jgi:hypothetical protein
VLATGGKDPSATITEQPPDKDWLSKWWRPLKEYLGPWCSGEWLVYTPTKDPARGRYTVRPHKKATKTFTDFQKVYPTMIDVDLAFLPKVDPNDRSCRYVVAKLIEGIWAAVLSKEVLNFNEDERTNPTFCWYCTDIAVHVTGDEEDNWALGAWDHAREPCGILALGTLPDSSSEGLADWLVPAELGKVWSDVGPCLGQAAIFIDKERVYKFLGRHVVSGIMQVRGTPTLSSVLCSLEDSVQILHGPARLASSTLTEIFYSAVADGSEHEEAGDEKAAPPVAAPRRKPTPIGTAEEISDTDAFACGKFVPRDDAGALRKYADVTKKYFEGPKGIKVYPLEVSVACRKRLTAAEIGMVPDRAQWSKLSKYVEKIKAKATKVAHIMDAGRGLAQGSTHDGEGAWGVDIIHFPPGVQSLALVGSEDDALTIFCIINIRNRTKSEEDEEPTWPDGTGLAYFGSTPVGGKVDIDHQGYCLRLARHQAVPFWMDTVVKKAAGSLPVAIIVSDDEIPDDVDEEDEGVE